MNNHRTTKQQRKIRISRNVRGTTDRPRLSIFRSNVAIAAQIIDDTKGVTLVAAAQDQAKAAGTKTEKAKQIGLELAKKAQAKKITKVVFDKGSYRYHGRVKAFADGAREGGLQF